MLDESPNKRNHVVDSGGRWKGWASTLIPLLILMLGGGFFYNELWLSKILTYTILPTYDLGNQVFTGLVVENRGRANLNDVQIIISDLATPIQSLNIPGTHELAQVVSGGVGNKDVQITMPRLSAGNTLAIYVLGSSQLTLQDKKNVIVTSKETAGNKSQSITLSASDSTAFGLIIIVFALMVLSLGMLVVSRLGLYLIKPS